MEILFSYEKIMFVYNLKLICLLNICDNWKIIMSGFNVGFRRGICLLSGMLLKWEFFVINCIRDLII